MTLSYPPRELWPERPYHLPELSYPETLNACNELLDRRIEEGHGTAPAIYFNDTVLTYADVLQRVTEVAAMLREQGIQPGDRILLRLFNRPHFITTWFAVLRLGAVVVATAPPLKHRELNAIIESAAPKLVISEPDLWEEIEKLNPSSARFLDITNCVGGVRRGESGGVVVNEIPCVPLPKDTLAILAYTSGSTGTPKGCMHSHADLLAVCDTYARYVLQPMHSDRFGGHPTMAFVYGLGGLLLFPFRFGASTVLLDKFTPEALAQTIQRRQVTIAFCAPTSVRMMMNNCPNLRNAVASLRYAITAGETLPSSVYQAWRETTGVEVLDGIGTTETLHMFISSRPGRSRAGATGEVIPGYEAMVVDENNFQPLADGQPGLLAVRGPTGCRYLNLPDRQQQYVRNGWNLPGDIYIRDSDGYFHYQCRNDDLIISGGINIAGPEIEGVLLEHPAVAEVAVIASPDDVRGMIPKAVIVLRPGFNPTEDLKKEIQTRVQSELASYKCPRKVDFVPELPKTTTGKIRRTELRRAEFADHLSKKSTI
jgi:2-aminobenzoate-CoA ligase